MKPVLLVVDVQNEYFAPHGKVVLPDGERALARIHALLGAARETGTPVVHIRHVRLGPDAAVFRGGSDGAALHPSIEVRPGEWDVLKHVPGAFTGTPLDLILRHVKADTVIVCGYQTQLCCDTTTRQARERDLAVLFAADATAARDLTLGGRTIPHDQVQTVTLAAMTQFATVLPTEAILARLRAVEPATSGAPTG